MKFVIYTDKAGESRWKLVSANNKIVADSGEGYVNDGNARRAIKAFRNLVKNAPLIKHKEKASVEE